MHVICASDRVTGNRLRPDGNDNKVTVHRDGSNDVNFKQKIASVHSERTGAFRVHRLARKYGQRNIGYRLTCAEGIFEILTNFNFFFFVDE